MHRGYIKDWRRSLEHPLFKKPLIWHFWGYCLKKASHKDRDCFLGGQVIPIKKGSFVFGRKKASEETGLTERQIRTALKHLEKLQNMTIKTTNKYSIISITNWDTYQQEEKQNDQQSDQLPTSYRPATDHRQECKELKNEKKSVYTRVIDYLNAKTQSDFKASTKTTKQHIDARLKEGFVPDDFKTVIDHKCQQWIGDPEMQEYLRPQTLFNSKFESYLNAARRNGTCVKKSKEQILKEAGLSA